MRVAAFLLLLSSLAASQPFEVVSIKPSRDNADSNLDSTRGRLTATSITVRELIRVAYGVKDYQIARAPGWLDGERYDIVATIPGGAKTSSFAQHQAQVRALLEDRFQLRTHPETKQMPVYLLVVDKNGAKVTPHEGPGSGTRKGCGHLTGTGLTMDVIAAVLSRQLDHDVLNRTGLQGKFDFQLDWTPDSGSCPTEEDSTARPSFFTAVRQQLGLRLQPDKGPVEFLIVDRVARPSEN